MTKQRALLSVSNKDGLEALGAGLLEAGFELIASGGTARRLREAGCEVTEVAEVTGAPEILGGRVKTLHPKVHGGILARRADSEHLAELSREGIAPFALVVVNLYPFEEAAARGVSEAELIEEVDIGGPTLLRAAAKSYADVAVLSSPEQYSAALEELRLAGEFSLESRRAWALAALRRTAAYDAAIVTELAGRFEDAPLPATLNLSLERRELLRYGENPHQAAALYAAPGAPAGLAGARLLGGKALSYNNLADAQGAWRFVSEWQAPTACVVKHASPCGACVDPDIAAAVEGAWEGDPLSAFGGIVAVNAPLTEAAAAFLTAKGRFLEVVIAPAYEEAALARLRKKSKLRILEVREPAPAALTLKAIDGGWLAQRPDRPEEESYAVVSARALDTEDAEQLGFAIHCVTHVRSNAIAIIKHQRLVGAGGGQPSRVDATRIAAEKAGERARGGILASDAFFPFADGVEAAAAAGIKVIVQPGGSIRDDEVTAAADRLDIVMVHTGRRHFLH